MTFDIKFRAWNTKTKQMEYDPLGDSYHTEGTPYNDLFARPLPHHILMQFTGLKDKNGKEIYTHDIVRVKCGIGDEESQKHGHYHDGYYHVTVDPLHGIELGFTKLTIDDPKNQFPVHSILNSYYRTLGVDSRNQKYDQIVVLETWGENHLTRGRWQQNHWSNDLEVVGNIYANPDYLR